MTVLSVIITTGIFAACSGKIQTTLNNTKNELKGSITASGSTALKPLSELGAKNFLDKNPGAKVNVEGGGSVNGLKLVLDGSVEIGNSDVSAEEIEEIDAAALKDHKVCVIGIAAVTNKKIKVSSLTKQQLIDIFTGKIINQKEVGGADIKITIINRPKSSGTRAIFKTFGLNGNAEVLGLTQDSSEAVKQAVTQSDGGISYLALSYFANKTNRKDLNILKIDGIEADTQNIIEDKYKIWAYEHMYTKGEPTEITKEYLDYMISKEMTAEIKKLGYIPISEMKVKR